MLTLSVVSDESWKALERIICKIDCSTLSGTHPQSVFEQFESISFLSMCVKHQVSLDESVPNKDLVDAFAAFLNGICDVIPVPVGLLTTTLKVLVFFLNIATFPVRLAQTVAKSHPILTFIALSVIVVTFFIVRRIMRQSVVSYFLYVFIPYCISFFYTIFSFFFPQLRTLSRIIGVLLHPIRWFLGIVEQVDRRAQPIREVVEVLSTRSTSTGRIPIRSHQRPTSSVMSSAERANDERIQCCICLYREKSILLRPCNHLCLCETCLRAVMNENPGKCPICRATIESHINVFL